MPSLKALNHRWLIGGDEIQAMSLLIIPARVLQGTMLFSSCLLDETAWLPWLYMLLTATYLAASCIVELCTIKLASMGSPTNCDQRSGVSMLVSVKTVVMFPILIVSVIFGFLVISSVSCRSTAFLRLLLPGLLITQVFELMSSMCCFYSLMGRRLDDPLLGRGMGTRSRLGVEHLENKWEKRCRFLCKCSGFFTCFLFGGTDEGGNNDFAMVARLLADYFEDDGNLDIVPSDVAAGLICLRHVQKVEEWSGRDSRVLSAERKLNDVENASRISAIQKTAFDSMASPSDIEEGTGGGKKRQVKTPRTDLFENDAKYWYRVANKTTLDPNNPEDIQALDEVARFARHALAIYTWMLYVYMDPLCGTCKLCNVRCCRMHSAKTYNGDACCSLHATALLAQANLDESELAYAHFGNNIVENPYCIVIDHKWQSVVISIRGTLSLEDCITDVLTETINLEESGRKWGFNGEGEYAHSGMVTCSEWIRNDLEKHKTLDKLMIGDNAPFKDYQLRVVGHSLGAGCSLFVALMLRSKFPNLKCLPFSPPGGLVSIKTARAVSPWTTSCILNSDIVPRLSLESMEHLRDETLELISRIKVSKMKVFKSAMLGPKGADRKEFVNEILHSSPPPSDFLVQLKQFKEVQQRVRAERGRLDISLYPPGKIIHFVKTEESNTCGGKFCGGRERGYTPMWSDNDAFTEIVISPSMALDHFPDRVCCVIEDVASGWNIDVNPGSKLAKKGVRNSKSSRDTGGGSPKPTDTLIQQNAV